MPASGTRAIVIGAGIGGLAAAVALRWAGIDVTVFERMPQVRELGAAMSVWPNGMKALRQLDLADAIRSKGYLMEYLENRSWQGERLFVIAVGDLSRKIGADAVVVQRSHLLATLLAAVDRESIHTGMLCTGHEQDASGVTVRFADGHEERADLLIGADGVASTIRTQLLGSSEPRYAGYALWRGVADCDVTGIPASTGLQYWGAGLMFAVLPVRQGATSWFAEVNGPPGGQDAPGERKKGLLERFGEWDRPVVEVIQATEENSINRTDMRDRDPDKRWGNGRVTLLGDAAHPMTHTLGLGANTAIEDSVVLAKCLRGGSSIVGALHEYEAQRLPRTAQLQRESRKLGEFQHLDNPLLCSVRDRAVKSLPFFGGLVTKQMEGLLKFEV